MGRKALDSFNDCFRWKVQVHVRCWQCGRLRVIENDFDSIFKEKGIRNNMPVLSIVRRLKCGNCGAKQPEVQLKLPRP